MIKFRSASVSDLPRLALLHKTSGVSGILTFLTNEQLMDFVYKPVVGDANFETRVAVISPDSVVGVICISNRKTKVLQTLSPYHLGLVVRLATQTIVNPKILRLVYNYVRMQRYIKSFLSSTGLEYKEIQFLLVDHGNQSQGVGTELMSLAINAENNYMVQTQNVRALDFYERFGFKVVNYFGFGTQRLWLLLKVANIDS